MSKQRKGRKAGRAITVNKKARHDYFVEERFEAGLALEGWEVKSVRAGRVQLKESHIQFRQGEAWLHGAHISPLASASTHVSADPTRDRKLLLHRNEIDRLLGAVERRGYTVIPLDMHWSKGHAKVEIGTAKGKRQYDKRRTEKERDWQRQKQRLMRDH